MTDLATLIDKPVATRTRYLSDDVQDCVFFPAYLFGWKSGQQTGRKKHYLNFIAVSLI